MKLRLMAIAAASALSFAASAAVSPQQLEQATARVDEEVVGWRRDIHQHPELGNREFRTSKLVAAHLRSLGLEVKTGIAHTGVIAVLRGGRPGPTIALRADMDALPVTEQTDLPFRSQVKTQYQGKEVGVMHACGHDAHVATLMGAATGLASFKEQLPGTILFIFQPAEEGAPEGEQGGAALMLREGLFDELKPQAVFGWHTAAGMPTGTIGYRAGPMMAGSDTFRMDIKGRQTHGSMPWAGIDPIVIASQVVSALQTIVSRQVDITALPAVLTIGSIEGGVRANIIPESVTLRGTLRTFDSEIRTQIVERMRRTASSIAAASGAEATVTLSQFSSPVVMNDPALTARTVAILQRLVRPERVTQIPLRTTSEDFAFYARQVPGFFFFIGVTPPDSHMDLAPANHSPLFYVDEQALGIATRAMMTIAVSYLQGE